MKELIKKIIGNCSNPFFILFYGIIITLIIFTTVFFIVLLIKYIKKKREKILRNSMKDSFKFLKNQAFLISFIGLSSIFISYLQSSHNIYEILSSFEKPIGRIYKFTALTNKHPNKAKIHLLYYNKNKNYYIRLFTKTKSNPNLIYPTRIYSKDITKKISDYRTEKPEFTNFINSIIIWAYYHKDYDPIIVNHLNQAKKTHQWGLAETNIQYFPLDTFYNY